MNIDINVTAPRADGSTGFMQDVHIRMEDDGVAMERTEHTATPSPRPTDAFLLSIVGRGMRLCLHDLRARQELARTHNGFLR